MRLSYPSNIKIIKLPCTGKIDVIHLLKSFEKGADGVYVLGCLEGACQFTSGNLRARKRVEQAQQILETVGIGGERVQMYNLSSSEAPMFVQFAKEMTEKIIEMGPNPIKLKKKAA
ncbi:MAG: hydrogenase iron-sulfur subunit [Deltaproteobacteria bacterium]|nr:hydrogenase iron-sulfur subunit [Deltaproteobacteria bacterium]MBW2215761.1 hydrogenase iron-sulfur subunit [Deltaproteobacteria bacterium]